MTFPVLNLFLKFHFQCISHAATGLCDFQSTVLYSDRKNSSKCLIRSWRGRPFLIRAPPALASRLGGVPSARVGPTPPRYFEGAPSGESEPQRAPAELPRAGATTLAWNVDGGRSRRPGTCAREEGTGRPSRGRTSGVNPPPALWPERCPVYTPCLSATSRVNWFPAVALQCRRGGPSQTPEGGHGKVAKCED